MAYFNWATRWFTGKAAQTKAKSEAEASTVRADTHESRRPTSSSVGNTAISAKDDVKGTGQGAEMQAENAGHSIVQTADSVADNTANAGHAVADKLKMNDRPKVGHRDSAQRIKQALHLDHKHPRSPVATAESSQPI